jgi:hypothetical protein
MKPETQAIVNAIDKLIQARIESLKVKEAPTGAMGSPMENVSRAVFNAQNELAQAIESATNITGEAGAGSSKQSSA